MRIQRESSVAGDRQAMRACLCNQQAIKRIPMLRDFRHLPQKPKMIEQNRPYLKSYARDCSANVYWADTVAQHFFSDQFPKE